MEIRAELIIRLMTDGKIQIAGPIHDKITCYALLECGRDAIKEFSDQMAKERKIEVVRAPGAMENGIAFDAKIGRG
jgi:6,7-dimethyl-8-ribityllumazine synthase